MAHLETLREFVEALEKSNELVRIKESVSQDLEISEFYFRQARSPGGGKALLFENVIGSQMPVLINAFGSDKRMEIAFGNRGLDDVAGELQTLLKLLRFKPPKSFGEISSFVKDASTILKYPPRKKRFGKPSCQEVVLTGDSIDLDLLPVLKCWPKDAGRFITMGLVFTRSLEKETKNMGMYRMQILDKNSTAMHWQIHKDGSHFFGEYKKQKKRMPVAVVIGADPSIVFSALAPMPPNVYELLLAGFIRSKGVSVTKCITNDLEVPAEAEIVLEGYVDPDDMAMEGPFGDHTGYYTPREPFPKFHITAITHRKNPIYLATVVGRSPQEDCYLAKATERLFLPMLQFLAPEVKDQMLPWDGVFHNCATFAIEKQFPFQARKLMSHLWGFSQMSFAKSIVVTDSNVKIKDDQETLNHVLNTISLKEDIVIAEGILDQLDHSGLRPLFGGKLGIDATTKIEGEGSRRQFKKKKVHIKHSNDAAEKFRRLCGANNAHIHGADLRNPVLILSMPKKSNEGKLASRIAAKLKGKKSLPFTIVLLIPENDQPQKGSLVLWRLFGNVDPIRDIVKLTNTTLVDDTLVVVDATAKNKHDGYDRVWPEENRMDQKTISLVDKKWQTIFSEPSFDVERP